MYRSLTTSDKNLTDEQQPFQKMLVNPGPDLLVCDEGHILKNEKTTVSCALDSVRTTRRIILTGTPLQNKLQEYFCMVNFVKPHLLGTNEEFNNRFANPIANGQFKNSLRKDILMMKRRSHVLHKLLSGCVQRFDESTLKEMLPPKHEYVLYIQLSPLQRDLYTVRYIFSFHSNLLF